MIDRNFSNGYVSTDSDTIPMSELPVVQIDSIESEVMLAELLGLYELSKTIQDELRSETTI